MVVVQGEEKGSTIVKEARERGASLLVLGQKKQHATWRLLMIWASQTRPLTKTDTVEYCINNAPCMAIAVRKRGKKVGGYTLTTKRHKDFWLLAWHYYLLVLFIHVIIYRPLLSVSCNLYVLMIVEKLCVQLW